MLRQLLNKLLKIPKNSKSLNSNSGYKGIWENKATGSFRARVTIKKNGSDIAIYDKSYNTIEEAIKNREDYIKSLF